MPYGIVILLGLVFGPLGALLLLTGRRTNPALSALGMVVVGLGGAIVAFLSLPADPSATGALGGLQTAALVRAGGWAGSWVIGLASLSMLAAAGARKAPRDTTWAAIVGAGCALVVLVTGVGGYFLDQAGGAGMFSYVRAAGYAVFGLLTALAMLSGGEPAHPGREAGGTAAVVFALLVTICETSSRGLTILILCFNIPTIEDKAQRAEVVTQYLDVTGAEIPWLVASIVLALGVGFVGLFSAARDGKSANWAAAAWLVLVPPVVWFVGAPGAEALHAASAALP